MDLHCPYSDGWADVVQASIKFTSTLIGIVPGTKDPCNPDNVCQDNSTVKHALTLSLAGQVHTSTIHPATTASSTVQASAVIIWTGRTKRLHPHILPELQPLSISPQDFEKLQRLCPSLAAVRGKASLGHTDQDAQECFIFPVHLCRFPSFP